MKVVNISKRDVLDILSKMIKMSNNSQTSKEIFLVITENVWCRLYWSPVSQTWLMKLFPEDKEIEINTSSLLKMSDSIKNLEVLGFQYKTLNSLDIYKVI